MVGKKAESGESTAPSLQRVLGRWDLTAIGVNQVVGSGIFVLPATTALLVGTASSPLVWIAGGLINALIVLCFAEAATRFRATGGSYLYAREAFGPFVGFEVAWMMWLTRVAAQAALANALALYLGYFWPGATEGVGRILVLTATIVGLAVINFVGVRYGSWTINLFTIGKLAPLGIFILLGFFFIEGKRLTGYQQIKLEGFGQAILLLIFAYGGYELISVPAGEAQSPKAHVPQALLMTIGAACTIFCLVQVVAVGTLPGLAESETPLADAAALFLGPVGGTLLAVGALISIAGANSGSMLAAPRMTFALGEGGQLPRVFAHVQPRFRTPDFSIAVYAAVALALALSGTFVQLAAASAVARLVYYAATCAAVPVLRRKQGPLPGSWQLPWGSTIPVLALIVSLTIIAGADAYSLKVGGIALAVGAGFYGLQLLGRRKESTRRLD
ncbi:MAG: APC family permease [Candidatus Acidoferrales bacterium]